MVFIISALCKTFLSFQLFQLILSPDLENDGTGCDNMTCIIIKFIQRAVRSSEGLHIQSGMATSGRSSAVAL